MKLLAVLTPPPAIYNGWSTQKTFWEDKFTPVNITKFGRSNVRKHSESKECENYIA